VDGVMAVTGRIAEIQQQFQRLAPPPVQPVSPDLAFGRLLQRSEQALAGHHAGPHGVKAPPGLESYGNGRIPEGALVSLGSGGHRLWGPAAEAFGQMTAAAAKSGVRLEVTDSYRSFDQQVDVAQRKGLYRNGGLAAEPGTSTHGWGLSVDVNATGPALSWLRRYGAEFGYVEDVAREPWHWTYTGS
jgi:zinc D-Ala-D-Ala carboxypeptidase